MSYKYDLQDERWFKRRLEIFNLRGKFCLNCLKKSKLHIHHIRYTGKVWEAPDMDLICLCETCHKKVHDLTDTSFTNEMCDELIKQFYVDAFIYDKIYNEFMENIETEKTYLIKDLTKQLNELSDKYNFNKKISYKILNMDFNTDECKVGRYLGITVNCKWEDEREYFKDK